VKEKKRELWEGLLCKEVLARGKELCLTRLGKAGKKKKKVERLSSKKRGGKDLSLPVEHRAVEPKKEEEGSKGPQCEVLFGF